MLVAFVVLSDGFEAAAELSTVLSFHYVELPRLTLPTPSGVSCFNPIRGFMFQPRQGLHVSTPSGVSCSNPVRNFMFQPRQEFHVSTPSGISCFNPVRGCMFIDTLRPESTSGRICQSAFPVGLTNSAGRKPGCPYL